MTERDYNFNQEPFTLEGNVIGGPKNLWKPIQADGKAIENAWEFINENSRFTGYNLKFPSSTLIDIYIEINGQIETFTIMGGNKASLDSTFKVKKAQLYFNSAEWDETHQNEWMLWEISDLGGLEKSNHWFPVGQIPGIKAEEPQKQRKSDSKALNFAVATALAIGGITAGVTIIKNLQSSGNTPPPAQQGSAPLEQNNGQTPVPDFLEKPLVAGQTISVTSGEVIRGDIFINGVPYMDSLPNTGLVTVFHQNATITAPYGAMFQYSVINLTIAEDYDVKYMQKQIPNGEGCGLPNGCESVDIINFPQDPPQGH